VRKQVIRTISVRGATLEVEQAVVVAGVVAGVAVEVVVGVAGAVEGVAAVAAAVGIERALAVAEH